MSGSEWLHEIKWDGWRIQIIKDDESVRIYSRTRTDLTPRLKCIEEAAQRLKPWSFILDAELIATDFYDIPAAIKGGRCQPSPST